MEVYLNYLSSLGVKQHTIVESSAYKYNPTIDIRLSTLVYAIITQYNIPIDGLPKQLIRDDATIKGVRIYDGFIEYYENIAASCSIPHMTAYMPIGYNDRVIDCNNIHGIIPPSVIFIETNKPVHLTPAIKYLLIYHLGKEFNINVELEFLYIDGFTYAPVTTTKPIKFLYISHVYKSDYVLNLFSFAKYVIFVPYGGILISPSLHLSHIINTPVESILVPAKTYTTSEKIIIQKTIDRTCRCRYLL
jgi:hypothetical protein